MDRMRTRIFDSNGCHVIRLAPPHEIADPCWECSPGSAGDLLVSVRRRSRRGCRRDACAPRGTALETMTSFHSCFGPDDGRQFRLVRVCVCNRLLVGICYLGGVNSFSVIILFEPFLWVSLTMVFLAGAFIAAQAPTMGSLAVRKFGDLAPMVLPKLRSCRHDG